MAVIYTVEQLQEVYRKSQSTTDKTERERFLNFILDESVNTANAYMVQAQRIADYYGIIIKKEQVTNTIVSLSQSLGIASTNVYGYAIAGLSYLYDAISKKGRNNQINETIALIEDRKAKITTAAQLYESAKKDLNFLKISSLVSNPLVWVLVFLVIIIFFSR